MSEASPDLIGHPIERADCVPFAFDSSSLLLTSELAIVLQLIDHLLVVLEEAEELPKHLLVLLGPTLTSHYELIRRHSEGALAFVLSQRIEDFLDLFLLESLEICCLQISPKGDLASRFRSRRLTSTHSGGGKERLLV